MKLRFDKRLLWLSSITCVTIFVQFLFAQESTSSEDEVYELSPFVVDTTGEVGYLASETLGGTRLRTDMKDLGASLTVLTQEFMDDLGATDMAEALAFTPSVGESEGDTESANSVLGNGIWGTSRPIRLRGFGFSNSASTDFFSTFSRSDRYNVERITVSRGPNSILFGIGGPGGVAVSSTKRANVDRKLTKVSLQVDSFGTERVAFDHNMPIIDGKLAARVNALYSDQRRFRDAEFDLQERYTLGLTFKPTRSTNIVVNYENIDREFSFFNKMTAAFWKNYHGWVDHDHPVVNFFSDHTWGGYNANTRPYVDVDGNRVAVAEGIEDDDGLIDQKQDFFADNTLRQNGKSIGYFNGLGLSNTDMNAFSRFRTGYLFNSSMGGTAKEMRINDPRLNERYNIPIDAALYPSSRKYPMQFENVEWVQAFVEQKILENLFVEYGFNKAEQVRDYSPDFQSAFMYIDPNKYLPDGRLNPGFGMPFNQATPVQYHSLKDNETHRLTVSYELDFTANDNWSKWLGRHSFALLGSKEETTERSNKYQYFNIGDANTLAPNGDPMLNTGNLLAGSNRMTIYSYYLGGEIPELRNSFWVDKHLDQLNSQGILGGNHGGNPGQTGYYGVNWKKLRSAAPTVGKTDVESESFAWQGKWFKDRLVTIFGYRKDSVKKFRGDSKRDAVIEEFANIEKLNGIYQTKSKLMHYHDATDIPFNKEASLDEEGVNRSYSIVYHALDWMSLTYSESSNFSPSSSPFKDLTGAVVKSNQGRTEDYGMKFYVLDSKLIMSLNYFENEATRIRSSAVWTGDTNSIINRMRNLYRDGDSVTEEAHPYFAGMADQYVSEENGNRVYSSTTTKGLELSVVYNPTPNWRIYVSGSKNENELTETIPNVSQWLFVDRDYTGFGVWQMYADEAQKVVDGQVSSIYTYDPTNEDHVSEAQNTATFIEDKLASAQDKFDNEIALLGVSRNRNGKYNANLVTSYRFSDGIFKNLSIGGNARFRSAPIVGYYRNNGDDGNPTRSWDVSRSVMGDSKWDVGAMLKYTKKIMKGKVRMNVQLNIYNLLDDDDPTVARMEHDTNGYFGEDHAMVPMQYQLREPRSYRLSVSFDY